MSYPPFLIVCEGFNTPPFRALKEVLNPEQIPYLNNNLALKGEVVVCISFQFFLALDSRCRNTLDNKLLHEDKNNYNRD